MRITLNNIYDLTSLFININPDINTEQLYDLFVKIDPCIVNYEPNINLRLLISELILIIKQSTIKSNRVYRSKKYEISEISEKYKYIFDTCENNDSQSDFFSNDFFSQSYRELCEKITYSIILQNRLLSKTEVYNKLVSETCEQFNYNLFSCVYDEIQSGILNNVYV